PYMLNVGFIGSLSAIVGWCADKSGMAPIITLIVFSAISLVCGFIYSKLILFLLYTSDAADEYITV
ncbi:hypothetical protein ACVGW9_00005, partial [Enterobacter hormaechei]